MGFLAASDFFRNSNYAEAALWCVLAVVIVAFGGRRQIAVSGRVVMFVTLVAFGASDVVEARTGAWWDPWWLLAWKGVCVAVLVGAVITFVRARRKREHGVRAPSGDG